MGTLDTYNLYNDFEVHNTALILFSYISSTQGP